jgi:hypothetical protein
MSQTWVTGGEAGLFDSEEAMLVAEPDAEIIAEIDSVNRANLSCLPNSIQVSHAWGKHL